MKSKIYLISVILFLIFCSGNLYGSEIIGTWESGIWYWDVAASEWTQMTTSTPSGDIAAGDFTDDGKADVASVWANGLWYQDGDTLAWTKVSGAAPVSLTAGDVNGDGRFEIIGSWSSGIWYWDLAASEWTQMTTTSPDGDIASGDFTGDAKADVASIWSSGLWYQDGATLEWTKVTKVAAGKLTAGDVNSSPLWPLKVGEQLVFEKYDNLSNQWDFTQQIVEQDTFEGKQYFRITKTNQNNEGRTVDAGYFRSTATEIYRYNSAGPDYLEYQKAPIGTKWSFYEERPSGFNYKVIEIVAIETITVPYGEFQDAYKHRRFRAVDPNDLSLGKSPDWYEWIVPDVAMWVMEEDYWVDNPPEWSKLTDIQEIPRPETLP